MNIIKWLTIFLDRLVGAPLEEEPTCTWTADEDGVWNTDCKRAFCLTEGDPEENHYRFCPGCGGKLVEKPYEWEEEPRLPWRKVSEEPVPENCERRLIIWGPRMNFTFTLGSKYWNDWLRKMVARSGTHWCFADELRPEGEQ